MVLLRKESDYYKSGMKEGKVSVFESSKVF